MHYIKHVSTGEVIEVSDAPVWKMAMWECGDHRFHDPHGNNYEVVSAPEPQVASNVANKSKPNGGK